MPETYFRHGNPVMIDYTPAAGDVTAGDVVLLGNTTAPTCGVAHHDITNNTKGAVAAGGGVYDVVNLNNAANYALVYWDFAGATGKVTTTSTNNSIFGYIVSEGGGGANSTAKAWHQPFLQ
jgi:hypothetical protein